MILRKLETEPGPSARMAGLASSRRALGVSARFRRRSLSSNPASGKDQEADGEDAPARRMVKAVRLQGMDSECDRGDRQSGQHRELTESHRNAVDEVRETGVHGKSSKVDVALQHL